MGELSSEAEITEEACTDTRPRYVMALTCKRKEFNKAHKFSDRDSSEDPNITMNDCRPYKDPNFETRRKLSTTSASRRSPSSPSRSARRRGSARSPRRSSTRLLG